jgi:hypothetical protein
MSRKNHTPFLQYRYYGRFRLVFSKPQLSRARLMVYRTLLYICKLHQSQCLEHDREAVSFSHRCTSYGCQNIWYADSRKLWMSDVIDDRDTCGASVSAVNSGFDFVFSIGYYTANEIKDKYN